MLPACGSGAVGAFGRHEPNAALRRSHASRAGSADTAAASAFASCRLPSVCASPKPKNSVIVAFPASLVPLEPTGVRGFSSWERWIDAAGVDDERTRYSLHRGHSGLLEYLTGRRWELCWQLIRVLQLNKWEKCFGFFFYFPKMQQRKCSQSFNFYGAYFCLAALVQDTAKSWDQSGSGLFSFRLLASTYVCFHFLT